MNSTSKISFRIHKCSWIHLGVCFRELVEKRNYAQSGIVFIDLVGLEQGAYTVFLHGGIYSHSIASEQCRQSGIKFQAGDVVGVELDPSTGKLTYSKDGASFTQDTIIRSTTREPVHFCAMLGSTDDISLV